MCVLICVDRISVLFLFVVHIKEVDAMLCHAVFLMWEGSRSPALMDFALVRGFRRGTKVAGGPCGPGRVGA